MINVSNSFKLILIRHGISKWNAANVYTGWYDIGLTQTGLQKSADLGIILNTLNLTPKIIFTSEQKRAIDTSIAIRGSLMQPNIPMIKHWRLNERHYGMLTGLDKTKYPFESKFYEMPPKIQRNKNDPILTNIPDYLSGEYFSKISNGESLYDIDKRLIPYFYHTILPFKEDMIIVSHNNTLKTLIKHIENKNDKQDDCIDIDNSLPIIYDVIPINNYEIQFIKSTIAVK
tara:strand:- start:280 stop:969 length:690 start_codon:yes stop_codon:yes gene_type:complete